jgi:hypothetical protein
VGELRLENKPGLSTINELMKENLMIEDTPGDNNEHHHLSRLLP